MSIIQSAIRLGAPRCPRSGDLVLDYGLDGETAANGLIRLPQVIAATGPRTVIIREGINDLTHGAATKEVAATLQEMVTAAAPTNVILVTLLPTGHIAFTVPSRSQR